MQADYAVELGLVVCCENTKLSLDFSILDYENDQKDATDLRTRLIYSF